MKYVVKLGLSVFSLFLFSGCGPSGGNLAIVKEASDLSIGKTTYTKLIEPISAKKFPLKFTNFGGLSKEERDFFSKYINTSGDFLPMVFVPEIIKSIPIASGYDSGILVMKGGFEMRYNLLLRNYSTNNQEILFELPIDSECIFTHKKKIETPFDSTVTSTCMDIAKQNLWVNTINAMEQNRDKLEKLNNEYQKSKEIF